MIRDLVKHGNNWAVVLDHPILDLLKIAPQQLTATSKRQFLRCLRWAKTHFWRISP